MRLKKPKKASTTTTFITTLTAEEKDKVIEMFAYIVRHSKEDTAITFLELIALITGRSSIDTNEIIGG